MAICLRRVFMNSGCVLLMARRNRHADYLCHKLLHSWLPTIGETAKVDLTLKARTCVAGNPLISIGRNGTCQYCTTPKYSFDNFANINTIHPGQGTLLFCAKESKAYKEDNQPKEIKPLGKAEPEQVMHILNVLSKELPKIFVRYLDYSIFHRDLILENNIKGTRKIGIHHLIKQVTLLRTVGHIKYAKVIFEILKITGHPEDGTVRVRWRIRGLSNYKALFSFMKYVTGSKVSELDGWYDAFSIFYVYSDGLVHKLTVDKVCVTDK
ncbi:hypothetical protein RUM44_013296 [Polyplax serrata]|uniref:Uncharacterized protein n=1 Tax=Polyplax serrata TaxID=468196 RepID=A0ABR1BDR2_POLSC